MNCINLLGLMCLLGTFMTGQSQDTKLEQRQVFAASDFLYDVAAAPSEASGSAGTIKPVSVSQMPALKGEGVSFTVFQIEPCGINLPHVHPRATEILYVINGKDLRAGFVEENSGRLIVNDMKAGQVTVFPQGLIHYQQNLGCEPVDYISGLNNEDPGVVTLPERFFQLPFEAVASSLGTSDAETLSIRAGLPANPAEGRSECLKRCRGVVVGEVVLAAEDLATRFNTVGTTSTSNPGGILGSLFRPSRRN